MVGHTVPSLSDAYMRLARADEHLAEVHARSEAICRTQAAATKIHVTPSQTVETGNHGPFAVVESASTPIEGELAVLVGDVVNNLRSCLDYLIGELAELDSGARKPRTQFPVERTPEAFRNRRPTYLAGLSDPHIAYVESLQPYNGVSWTAKLARMSNWDKHNKLVIVAHDYLLGGVIEQRASAAGTDMSLDVQLSLTPSLRVQLEDGNQLLPTLVDIRNGVAATLDYYGPEFPPA
jgi:hypothetical protein